ncbi:MAG TPA: TIGR00153 family protein [Candidatus Acetothermia bacterium]|nr:TIGR00153 family protein [Candidatus Acetothermia bacterium]
MITCICLMAMVIGKGWKRLEKLVGQHLSQVEEALSSFEKSIDAYLRGDSEQAEELAYATHRAEGRADDVRRKVETEILRGALLASSRRDILEIIEGTDKLANAAEAALDYLIPQRVEIPEELEPLIRAIVSKSADIMTEVKTALHLLFSDMQRALESTHKIEALESEVDRFEREAIQRLFQMDIDLAQKLHVRGFIEELVEISDRAEDLSDRIEIMVAQRRA